MFKVMMLGNAKLLQAIVAEGVTVIKNKFSKKSLSSENLSFFLESKPDIVFYPKKYIPNISVLEKLKKAKKDVKIVAWSGDVRARGLSYVLSKAKYIDLFLTNHSSSYQASIYKKAGIKFGSFYSTVSLMDLEEDTTNYDLFFGGGNYGKKFPLSVFRRDIITTLSHMFKMDLYGRGWSRIKSHKPLKGANRQVAYVKAIRSAKINLGINHFCLPRYYGYRNWNCLASGRLHIVHYIPEMEKDFENHKHLVWFKTKKHCISLIKYYLAHDKEREEISRNARKLMLEGHSYKNRAKTLVGIFTKLLNE